MFPSTANNKSSLAVRRCTQNPTLACTLAKMEAEGKVLAQMAVSRMNRYARRCYFVSMEAARQAAKRDTTTSGSSKRW